MLLNKRAGVLVHEDTDAGENTLIMHVKAYLAQKGEYSPDTENSFAPALCNRIDRNTGGIVIAAKNSEALRVMNEKIRNNRISKYYLCLVHGVPKKSADTLYGYLRKNADDNIVEVRDREFPGSKEIITKYKTIGAKDECALLEVELITGRTHQIRAHMAHVGHSLLGDGKYGINREEKSRGYKYQALYSYKLHFKKTEEENALSYLEGKTFEVDRDKIWFVKDMEK
jgi:23S rRNA pseudouridine955/2504/2580 synthase